MSPIEKNAAPLTGRRLAREVAFQYLYGILPEAGAAQPVLKPMEFDEFCKNFEQKPEEFAWELVEGTGKNLPSLDETIKKHSTNWRIERMPKVDLTILRMACYEILHRPDVPKTVSINEAVELAKKFGAEDSPAFVNGLLDKLEKTDAKA